MFHQIGEAAESPTVAPSDNPGGAFSISSVDMLRDYFLKTGFSNFNADKIEVTVAQTDTAEQIWQGMTEMTEFQVLLLSKCLMRRSWKSRTMLLNLLVRSSPQAAL